MSRHSGLLVTEQRIGGEKFDFKGKDNFFEALADDSAG
jgi:hypothetical protein